MGGENEIDIWTVCLRGGSSPRGRGKQCQPKPQSYSHGLIPAWAGKTESSRSDECDNEAHPRVGGENSRPATPPSTQSGSSPRGRGKHFRSVHRRRRQGLIPAWAGKTFNRELSRINGWAHPRVGGENRHGGPWLVRPGGSSPRGRGKHSLIVALTVTRRLIPAWAGKTLHTRSVRETGGSSPRGRGKRRTNQGPPRGPGLIPAWAGKT